VAVPEPWQGTTERARLRVARWLGTLPPSWQVRLSGQPAVRLDGLTLDPHLQLLLALDRRQASVDFSTMSPAAVRAWARRAAAAAAGAPIPVGAVADVTVDGAAGPLAARHYAPTEPDGPHPLLVYLHGGGFVIGDLDTHDQICRLLCRYAGVHVLSVAYRLAPEHPFPAAVEDARAALRWACANAGSLGADADADAGSLGADADAGSLGADADAGSLGADADAGSLGADPARVAIGGDSAGANLSTVVSQLATRDGGPVPAAQLLLYPTTDRATPYPSLDLFADGFFLTRQQMDWYDEQYFVGSGADPTDPLRCPLRAADLSGLPPALVVTAGFDPLRDEGEAYAAAMAAAGTPVTVRREASMVHGFANMVDLNAAARAAMLGVARDLRTLLAQAPRLAGD
jgi:acetyl esterase